MNPHILCWKNYSVNSALIRSKMVVADFSTIDLSIVLFIIGNLILFVKVISYLNQCTI